MRSVYLDYHATTPVDPRVLEAMLPYFTEKFGNAASRSHAFGWEAEKAVDRARRRLAELAGAEPREIVITSGATESNNLAIKGVAEAAGGRGNHIVTMATEHKAVLDSVGRLEHLGFRATILPPEPDGLLSLERLRASLLPETILVSVMYANNEIGTIQPIPEIGAICREHGIVFHCDAAQAFGKIPIDVVADHVDLLSMSAHKICGPKGVGALYVRRRGGKVGIAAQIDGGGHEGGMRSGTLNVPGIVGFGEACAICAQEMVAENERLRVLRDCLLHQLESGAGRLHVNGTMERRLPGNLNVSFEGIDGDALLTSLPDVAISAGSACTSGYDASYVLKALGVPAELAQGAARFGLGRFTTAEEIDYAARRVTAVVSELRALSPVE